MTAPTSALARLTTALPAEACLHRPREPIQSRTRAQVNVPDGRSGLPPCAHSPGRRHWRRSPCSTWWPPEPRIFPVVLGRPKLPTCRSIPGDGMANRTEAPGRRRPAPEPSPARRYRNPIVLVVVLLVGVGVVVGVLITRLVAPDGDDGYDEYDGPVHRARGDPARNGPTVGAGLYRGDRPNGRRHPVRRQRAGCLPRPHPPQHVRRRDTPGPPGRHRHRVPHCATDPERGIRRRIASATTGCTSMLRTG